MHGQFGGIFGYQQTMKIMKFIATGLAGLLFSLLAACTSSNDPADAYKGETAQQIYHEGETSLRDGSYADAIKHFEALDVQYPFGRDTRTAQLHIIYAYYKNADFVSAESAADRYIHAYPTDPNVAYAYYMRGLSSYYQNMGVFERLFSVDYATRDLTQVKKAFNDFAELEKRYPESPYAPAAHQYMIYLRNVLANHQIEVAQFYFNRQAYVAAANRASMVVEHYQGAPVVPDALVIMVKSYHQLRQTDLENQALKVLAYNYPDSIYLHEVSGKELTSPKVVIAPKQEKSLPPEPKQALAPPSHPNGAVVSSYQNNGVRGSTTTVADIVQDMRKSGLIKPAQPQQPVVQQQQAVQSVPQPAVQTKQVMTESVTSPDHTVQTAANTPQKVTLADVWKKLAPAKSENASKDATSVPAHNQVVQSNGDRR